MPIRLSLNNWQCHKELVLSARNAVDLVIAENMRGKTALRDALEFAIAGTGHLRGIGTKKDLALLSIHEDEPKCSVEVTVTGAHGERVFYVLRGMDRAGGQSVVVGGKDGTMQTKKLSDGQAIIWKQLGGIGDPQLWAVLGSESLFILSGKERRTLVSSVLEQMSIDKQELIDRLERRGIEKADADEFALLVIAEGWRVAEDTAARRRADAKAAIKELGTKPAPVARYTPPWSEDAVDLSRLSEAGMEERLAAYRSTMAKAREKSATSRGALEATLQALESQHRAATEELEPLAENPPDIGALRAEYMDQDARHSERVIARADARNARDDAAAVVAALGEGSIERPDPCPVIPGQPKCPMTPTKLKAHREKIVEQRVANIDRLNEAQAVLDAAELDLAAAATAKGDASAALEAAEGVRDRMTALEADVSRLDGEIESKAKLLADAELEPVADSDFLEKRIERGEHMIRAKRQYDTDLASASTYDETLGRLTGGRDRWDAMAQALKPDQIEAEFTGRMVAPMREAIERFGKRFGGMRLDDEYNVEWQWRGRWRRYQQLSESGRLRIGWAVQYAFARLTRFPVLVIDQIDHLDAAGKQQIIETLRDVSGEFHAVIGLATSPRGTPKRTPYADVTTWHLVEGEPREVR
jgi:hypothetical protein